MPRLAAKWRRLSSDTSGAALVEFALSLSFLLILLIGVAEIGRLLADHHAVARGVQAAGHYLARVPDPEAQAAQDRAFLVVRAMVPHWPNDPSSLKVELVEIDNSAKPKTFYGRDKIHVVQVTATFPFTSNLLRFLGMGPSITFLATHEERHIGE